jgi:DNA-binding Lrp family transcriptional regulator
VPAKLKPHERQGRDEAILSLLAKGTRPSAIAKTLNLDVANVAKDIKRLKADGIASMSDVLASERWLQVEGIKEDMAEVYKYMEKSKQPKVRRSQRTNDDDDKSVTSIEAQERDGDIIQSMYLIRSLRADLRELLGLNTAPEPHGPMFSSVADIAWNMHDEDKMLKQWLERHPERALPEDVEALERMADEAERRAKP